MCIWNRTNGACVCLLVFSSWTVWVCHFLQCRQQNPCLPGSRKPPWAQGRPIQCRKTFAMQYSSGGFFFSHNPPMWTQPWYRTSKEMTSHISSTHLRGIIDKGTAWTWLSFLSCCRGVSIVVSFCELHDLFLYKNPCFSSKRGNKETKKTCTHVSLYVEVSYSREPKYGMWSGHISVLSKCNHRK